MPIKSKLQIVCWFPTLYCESRAWSVNSSRSNVEREIMGFPYNQTLKKQSKLCITGPFCWESASNQWISCRKASNEESTHMSWCHHGDQRCGVRQLPFRMFCSGSSGTRGNYEVNHVCGVIKFIMKWNCNKAAIIYKVAGGSSHKGPVR